MKTRISDFPPNTDARRAAETLVGLVGVGALAHWVYGDVTNTFTITMRDGAKHEVTPRQVMDIGLGARAVLAVMQDQIEMMERRTNVTTD